jgi:hypothetical protein
LLTGNGITTPLKSLSATTTEYFLPFVSLHCKYYNENPICQKFYANKLIIASNCKLLVMRNNTLLVFLLAATISSCSSSKKTVSTPDSPGLSPTNSTEGNFFRLTVVSNDDSYGYTEKDPINVGGAKKSEGPANERRFLNALLGPEGQSVTYYRIGSCCVFKTPNGLMGSGLLDKYEVKYKGIEKPVVLYLNMYDTGELKAPKGFTFRQ